MKRHELEHLIRAAGSITGSREIYIVGSLAILASVTSGPEVLFVSREADVFVDQRPELSDLVDAATLHQRIEALPIDREARVEVLARLQRLPTEG